MTFWEDMFGNPQHGQDWWERRHEREQSQRIVETINTAAEQADWTFKRFQQMQTEIDRLHLMVEAMSEVMTQRLGVSRWEIGTMIERVDLADGVADGRVGPDRVEKALKCPSCSRPVNPMRDECVYCGQGYEIEALEAERKKQAEAQAKEARLERLANAKYFCSECAKEVQSNEVVFGPRGIYCQSCGQG